MDKVVELIVSWIQKNLRNPKFYAVLAVLLIIVVLIFPYIDANFFFFNKKLINNFIKHNFISFAKIIYYSFLTYVCHIS